MKIIGITGGIGSGKSTVTEYLIRKGFTVIDADKISRSITTGRTETVIRLEEIFGKIIIKEDGTLNRQKLADIVFNDRKCKDKLEEVVTRQVQVIIDEKVEKERLRGSSAVFIDAPLLFETGAEKDIDESWLITAPEEIRIARVVKRDGITEKQVEDRIRNQMSDDIKAEIADVIFDNSGEREDLYIEIEKQLEKYV